MIPVSALVGLCSLSRLQIQWFTQRHNSNLTTTEEDSTLVRGEESVKKTELASGFSLGEEKERLLLCAVALGHKSPTRGDPNPHSAEEPHVEGPPRLKGLHLFSFFNKRNKKRAVPFS